MSVKCRMVHFIYAPMKNVSVNFIHEVQIYLINIKRGFSGCGQILIDYRCFMYSLLLVGKQLYSAGHFIGLLAVRIDYCEHIEI